MSEVKIYRKTATVQAEQFDGWMKTAQKYGIRIEPDKDLSGVAIDELVPRGKYYLPTPEGMLETHQGDWIATGVDGEHWAIAEDVFKRTYAELPVIPSYAAKYMESCKKSGETLFSAIFNAEYMVEDYTDYPGPTLRYISRHCETFARAWLDGYQIEEEK